MNSCLLALASSFCQYLIFIYKLPNENCVCGHGESMIMPTFETQGEPGPPGDMGPRGLPGQTGKNRVL